MTRYERLKLEYAKRVFEMAALKRAMEKKYPHLKSMPAKRSYKTWLREAKELREATSAK